MSSHVCRRRDLKGYSPPPRGFIFGPELSLPAAWTGTTSALTRNSRSSVPRCEQQSFTLGPRFVTEAKWTAPQPVRDPPDIGPASPTGGPEEPLPGDRARELRRVEARIGTSRTEQLLVPTLLDDRPRLHHQDEIGIADRREPVRDDKARPTMA